MKTTVPIHYSNKTELPHKLMASAHRRTLRARATVQAETKFLFASTQYNPVVHARPISARKIEQSSTHRKYTPVDPRRCTSGNAAARHRIGPPDAVPKFVLALYKLCRGTPY